MATRPHVFYLHGLASSARGTKAEYFADRLRLRGIELHCPDFNEPDFETLTTSRMIAQVDSAIDALSPAPVVLIGSSLGGFVAFHVAARQAVPRGRAKTTAHPVDRLILLAPAFDFGRSPLGGMDAAGLARWRETDRWEVFHHAEDRLRFLRFSLYEDAQRYASAGCALDTPTLVFQGIRDDIVDPAMVRRFAAGRPSMTVRFVNDGHQLTSSLDLIWRESAAFLGFGG